MGFIGVDNPSPTLNTAPTWTGTPAPVGTIGTSKSINLNTFSNDIDGDTITFSLNAGSSALPTGWAISSPNLTYDGTGAAGSTAGIIIDASDGINSPTASTSFTITIQEAPAFPLFDVYSAIVTARSGSPVPESNTAYWDKPTYPTSAASTETTTAALVTAVNAASPGDTIFLQDGTYTDSGTLNFTASGTAGNPITIAAETKNGVVLSGDVMLQLSGNYLHVMGFDFTGTNDEPTDDEAIVYFTGSDNLAAYLHFYSLAASNAGDNLWNVRFINDRNRFCYSTSTAKNIDRAIVRMVGSAEYCRVDHVSDLNHIGTGDSGDFEFIQTHQNTASDNGFHLIDNCYIYRHNNPGGGDRNREFEREVISAKNSKNLFIQNVMIECMGCLNDRSANYSTYYGNWIFGGNLDWTGGINVSGLEGYVFCNYIDGVNLNRNTGVAGIGIVDDESAGSPDYEKAVGCEISFNTIINSGLSLSSGVVGGGGANPSSCDVYNNLIDYATGTSSFDRDQYTAFTFGGNVFKGKAFATKTTPSGVTSATPALTSATVSGRSFYFPASAGNCDGTGVTTHSSLITHDIIGNEVPAASPDVGAIQPGFSFSVDPVQAIIDASGHTA